MPYDHHASAAGDALVPATQHGQIIQERFVCPFPATPFVAGPENKHFGQLWDDLQVVASVDTCSMIHHHDFVTILLQGPKDGVTKALQKLSRCLMNYNPQRDPHNEQYRGPGSRGTMRGVAPYRYPRQRSASAHRGRPHHARAHSNYVQRAARAPTPPHSTHNASDAEEDGEITLHPSDGEVL